MARPASGPIHFIRDAEISKGDEESVANTTRDPATINQVFLAEPKKTPTVGALRGGRELDQKFGGEVCNELAISGGSAVMKQGDRNVIEKLTEMLLPAQGLNGSAEDVGVRKFLRAGVAT